LLLDPSFLLRRAEIFVRGFEIPWSFSRPVLYQTWATFYQFTEYAETFQPGFDLMNAMIASALDSETIEITRTLVHNRLVNICFTRDGLQFLESQKWAALRLGAAKQQFAFEIAYYLNFYYLLLFGALDHAASLVNGVCRLGLRERSVGVSSKPFLEALEKCSPALHSAFTRPSTVEAVDRFAALRHYAAHRGSIMPTKIVERPEQEPTQEEIDAAIGESGKNAWMLDLPEGPQKEMLLNILRSNTKAELYEKKTLASDMVFVQFKGESYFMNPLADTTWNFRKLLSFLHEVFAECGRLLAPPAPAT